MPTVDLIKLRRDKQKNKKKSTPKAPKKPQTLLDGLLGKGARFANSDAVKSVNKRKKANKAKAEEFKRRD